jgi:leader peptidase (prepilin peptidase)/N-methyltransferase
MTHAAISMSAIAFFNASFIVFAGFGANRTDVPSPLLSRGAIAILIVGLGVQAVLATRIGGTLPMLATVAAFAAVSVSAATDAATGYVFDAVTLPALGVLFLFASVQNSLPPAAWGACAAGGAMAFLYGVTLGRGLGLGDVKLAFCIGAALGVHDGLIALGAAFVIGGIYAAFLLITRRASKRNEVRFAPYLAAGMAAVCLERMYL